jgi:hypothetical protein
MDHNITALERAFQLAKTGTYPTVQDIKQKLKSEGYAQNQISGPTLYRQLREIIRGANRGSEHLNTDSEIP